VSNQEPPDPLLSHGVLGGQVVSGWANDDQDRAMLAASELRKYIAGQFQRADLTDGTSLQGIRNTPFRVWHDRAPITAPDGSTVSMGYRLCVAIPGNAHPKIKHIVNNLPSHFQNFEVWAE
jgi:hypothetical protein